MQYFLDSELIQLEKMPDLLSIDLLFFFNFFGFLLHKNLLAHFASFESFWRLLDELSQAMFASVFASYEFEVVGYNSQNSILV